MNLQNTAVKEGDDELTKTTQEKDKANNINTILRKKSESQAKIANAQAQQNARLEKRLAESEAKFRKAAESNAKQDVMSPAKAAEKTEGKEADTPAAPMQTDGPETERELLNADNNELHISEN